ncbi:hypothetical protein D3C84_371950 [compost metagenome]
MDVVAHAGAVRRRVVVAKHPQFLELADTDLADVGQQVVGNAVGIFADEATLMGTDRVEVAQQHDGPAGIGLGKIPQNLFHHQLGATIGVGGAGGEIFPQGHRSGIAIDGRRGAEHQAEHAGFCHLLAQHQGTGHVVLVVGERDLGGLPDRLEAGEVDHGFDPVLGKQPLQACPVQNVPLDEGDRLAGDPLDPLERFRGGVGEVVQYYHLQPGTQQLNQGVGADIAGTARDQNCHFLSRALLKLGQSLPARPAREKLGIPMTPLSNRR